MTTIIVTHEDNEVDEFEFESRQDSISIGRRSTNDVCIPNLSISGNHARISLQGDEAVLEDMNSTNGSYINGQAITRQTINKGDSIILGKIRLAVVRDAPRAEATPNNATDGTSAGIGSQGLKATAASAVDSETMAVLASDFGDGHYAKPEEIDPLSINEAHTAPAEEAYAAPTELVDAADKPAHPLEGMEIQPDVEPPKPLTQMASSSGHDDPAPMHELDNTPVKSKGAVIEIKNGAKSGQILPIDKPVTTLGRPGIQIAAIMRKPDGYFLMHIESDDSVDRPTLNRDAIGDEPVLLHSGDELNVAGIDVEFMLS